MSSFSYIYYGLLEYNFYETPKYFDAFCCDFLISLKSPYIKGLVLWVLLEGDEGSWAVCRLSFLLSFSVPCHELNGIAMSHAGIIYAAWPQAQSSKATDHGLE